MAEEPLTCTVAHVCFTILYIMAKRCSLSLLRQRGYNITNAKSANEYIKDHIFKLWREIMKTVVSVTAMINDFHVFIIFLRSSNIHLYYLSCGQLHSSPSTAIIYYKLTM